MRAKISSLTHVAPRLANSSFAHSSNLYVVLVQRNHTGTTCRSQEFAKQLLAALGATMFLLMRPLLTVFGCPMPYAESTLCKRLTCNTFDGCRLHIESRCNPPASHVHPDRVQLVSTSSQRCACPLICGWVAHPQTWRGTYRSFSRPRKAPVRSSADTVAASEVLASHQG